MIPHEVSGYLFIIIKVLGLMGLVVYVIFSWILVRQEQLMAHVLEESFEPIVRIAAAVHFIAACVVLLLAALFL